MGPENLLKALISLFERLQIPYYVTGSVASMAYGEPRFTDDVDIVADLKRNQVDALLAAFPPPDYYVSRAAIVDAIRLRHQFNIIHLTEGVKADIILQGESRFDRMRMDRRRPIAIGQSATPMTASPEDVILKKMDFYKEGVSEKHLRDITGMMKIWSDPIDRAYIEHWAKELGVTDIWRMILERLGESTG